MNNFENWFVITYPTVKRIQKYAPTKQCEVLGLYMFYYTRAKEQGTHRVYATTGYCSKGLHWNIKKVRQIKQILLDLKLITEISANGRYSKSYIQINCVPVYEVFNYKSKKKEKTQKENNQKHTLTKTLGGENLPPKNNETNAGYGGANNCRAKKLPGIKLTDKCFNNEKNNCFNNEKGNNFSTKNVERVAFNRFDSNESVDQEVLVKEKTKKKKTLVKPKVNGKNTKKHKSNVSLNLPKKLPKIKEDIKIKNLKTFNFPEPVFKVLAHWYKKGGIIPQDSNRRKSADRIALAIEELLMSGLNTSYVKVLKENEFKLKTKKWTVDEIIQCIDYHVDEMKKDIWAFPEFLLMNHNPKVAAYSPLIIAYNKLPEKINPSAQYLRYRFDKEYPEIFIYDTVLINVGKQLEEIHQKYEIVNENGAFLSPDYLFYNFIVDLANEKGKDILQYMSSKKTIQQFMEYKKHSFALRTKDNPREKELKEEYNYFIRLKKNKPNKKLEGFNKIRFKYLRELFE